jgi:hypothetical protein
MSQPYFEKSVRMRLRLPKWGFGSPTGFSKVQSSILKVKTPCIGAFFISLESYRSVDVANGLAWAIWTSTALVMAKRKVKSQIGNLTPTTKSWESTRPQWVQVKWDTPLEISQQELQLCFRPCLDPRSEQRVIVPQSCGSPNFKSFGTPPWESRNKKPFECGCRVEAQIILYGGRCWLPWVRAVVSLMNPKLLVACRNTKGAPENELTNLFVSLM